MNQHTVDAVARVISNRRTTKRLCDPGARHEHTLPLNPDERAVLKRMLEVAGQAPFHKPADADTHRQESLASPVPWRFHVLEPEACVALLDWLEQQAATDTPPWVRAWASKVPALLAAAGVLVMATWLPNPSDNPDPEFSHANIEHVAAAGAAVQNLMLMAEASDWDSYWSSGGVLREPDTFERLGISTREQLLGAILLTPRTRPADKIMPGGLFDKRGTMSDWTRRVAL